MYRIELAPGEETVFRTLEELAVGIRNGVVTSRSRIYHGASQKWLPIEFHPHYKKALDLSVARTAETPAPKPAERSHGESVAFASVRETRVPTFAPGPAPERGLLFIHDTAREPAVREQPARHAAVPAPEPEPPPPQVIVSPTFELPKISYPEIRPAEEPVAERPAKSRTRRPLHLASVAVILTAGGYVGVSEFSPSPTAAPTREAISVPRPAMLPAALDSAEPETKPEVRAKPTAPPAQVTRPTMSPARAAVAPSAPPAVVAPSQPASSGFAPALEPRAQAGGAAPKTAAPAKPSSAPADSIPALAAPAPSELDLVVPAIPDADSLLPSAKGRSDSAMKRILRAVNGGKDIPQRP